MAKRGEGANMLLGLLGGELVSMRASYGGADVVDPLATELLAWGIQDE